MGDDVWWVYILASRTDGVLYVGMTDDLAKRVWQHREGAGSVFTKRYGVTRLVYAERHTSSAAAAQREFLVKRWRRAWKVQLIEANNPDWCNLFETEPW